MGGHMTHLAHYRHMLRAKGNYMPDIAIPPVDDEHCLQKKKMEKHHNNKVAYISHPEWIHRILQQVPTFLKSTFTKMMAWNVLCMYLMFEV